MHGIRTPHRRVMPSDLSGVPLADPDALYRDFVDKGWPAGRWAGLCNSFASPAEREPGVAHVLIYKSDWDRIPDKTSLALTFQDRDGRRVKFPQLHVVAGPNPLPQEHDPADPVLWLTLEDRRSRFRAVSVGRDYNLRMADGSWDAATTNSGTPYTWAEMVDEMWDLLAAVYTDLPLTAPALPSTPSGTPESFYFDATNAWDGFCTVCQAAGFLARFDPTADTGGVDGPVTVIDPSAAAAAEPVAAKASRTWDTAAFVSLPEAVPADVTVSYRRIGRGDRHNADAALSESGTTAGAAVVLEAYPQAAGNPVSNATYLTAFAGRVRDFWRRDVAARTEPRSAQYRGYQSWCKSVVGLSGYAAWGVSELRADEVQTSVTSGPLLRLDRGEFVPARSSGYGPDRRPMGFCVIKNGSGYVTDVLVTWLEEDGSTTCETVGTCPGGVCDTVWYCTPDGPEEVAVGDPPPADWTGGPYDTEAEAETYCPYPPVYVSGCATPYPHTITLTFSGFTGGCAGFNGSVDLDWDGSKWTGVYAAPAGNVTCDITPSAGGGGSVSFLDAYTSGAYTVAGAGSSLGSCGAYPAGGLRTLSGGCAGTGTVTISA